jgi:pimeloyl-ACP methyl ester carboxylesterase
VATKSSDLPSDLRAAAQLASAATLGLVGLVEAVHARIAQTATLGLSPPTASGGKLPKTRGITGQVYRAVRGVTGAVGSSADLLLAGLQSVLQGPEGHDSSALPSRERAAVLAALNGVLGDHLAATGNSLATPMSVHVADGKTHPALDTSSPSALAQQLPNPGGRLLVLVHGLCMNDLQWFAPLATNDEKAGTHLQSPLVAALCQAQEHGGLGYTAVALRYNSGLHVGNNGQQLAQLLQQLLAAWPQPLQRLAIVGHSMGGLVARSAMHQAQLAGLAWAQQLTHLVCLGTPHMGAPLERAGHGVDLLLGATPYSAPFAALSRLRSAGITDLRHGHLLVGATSPGAGPGLTDTHVPLPTGVRCCAVAATLQASSGKTVQDLLGDVLGDGLVPVASALGRGGAGHRRLDFLPNNQTVLHNTGHLQLLQSDAVAVQVQQWLV